MKDLSTPLLDAARRDHIEHLRLLRKALADPDDPLEGAGLTAIDIVDRWYERVFDENGSPCKMPTLIY